MRLKAFLSFGTGTSAARVGAGTIYIEPDGDSSLEVFRPPPAQSPTPPSPLRLEPLCFVHELGEEKKVIIDADIVPNLSGPAVGSENTTMGPACPGL